jgi:outer membrane protein assembly factor BamB
MDQVTSWDGPIVEFDMTAPVPQDHPAGGAIQTSPDGVPPQTETPATPQAPDEPRIWPGVLIAVLVGGGLLAVNYLLEGGLVRGLSKFAVPALGLLMLLVWWLAASRVGWGARIGFPLLAIAFGVLAYFPADRSMQANGGMGFVLFLWVVVLAWPLWLLVAGGMSWPVRAVGLGLVLLLSFGLCDLLRIEGSDGSIDFEVDWRWSPTKSERNLAERDSRGEAEATEVVAGPGDWLGFRGERRDGVASGVKLLETNWSEKPPKRLWKFRAGPGWSSFAVVGGRIYTQEQLGKEEAITCYEADTGKIVWTHKVGDEFWELMGGAGPRATPTFHDGRIYALGTKGKLNCLDPATGKSLWNEPADLVKDSGGKVPEWGFSSSPCVVKGVVSVYAGGPDGKAVLGYDARTGKLKWAGGNGGHGYASTQLVELAGVPVLLVASNEGLLGVAPDTGKEVLNYSWPMKAGPARCVQSPAISDNEVLLGTGFGQGTRRVKFTVSGDELKGEEVWTTNRLSPYYTDFVVHEGHIYGFDNGFLTCLSLEDGSTKWRKRGFSAGAAFGHGQLVLLPEQGLLLVQAEKSGHVGLVDAKPEYRDKGSFKAIAGKTWNHPVIAHGRLFLRNSDWMVCYEVK